MFGYEYCFQLLTLFDSEEALNFSANFSHAASFCFVDTASVLLFSKTFFFSSANSTSFSSSHLEKLTDRCFCWDIFIKNYNENKNIEKKSAK